MWTSAAFLHGQLFLYPLLNVIAALSKQLRHPPGWLFWCFLCHTGCELDAFTRIGRAHLPVISTADHRAEPPHEPSMVKLPSPEWAGLRMLRENVNNMPQTSRETESEEEMRDRQQRKEETPVSHNIVTLLSQFADDNLTLVRVGVSFVWKLGCIDSMVTWLSACICF